MKREFLNEILAFSEAEGFCEMSKLDSGGFGKVGNGACYLDSLEIGAGGEVKIFGGFREEFLCSRF